MPAKNDTYFRHLKPGEKDYKLSDSGGLFMLVTTNGSKLWRFSYRFDTKQKLLALGQYPVTSLADARIKRDDAKKLLARAPDSARSASYGSAQPTNFPLELSNTPSFRGATKSRARNPFLRRLNAARSSAFSWHACPSCAGVTVPQNQRAQGKPDALRTRSLVCERKKHTSSSPQVRRSDPAFPARLVLTVSFVLSLVSRALLPPSPTGSSRRLDISVGISGPHDFAVRSMHVRLTRCRVHRILCPTLVTIAKRPS